MKHIFSILIIAFLAGCASSQNMRQVISTPMITEPAPASPQLVKVPEGYRNCIWTEAKFKDGRWIPSHQVCEYSRHRYFTSAHWQCRLYTLEEGQCLKWVWVKGKWHHA